MARFDPFHAVNCRYGAPMGRRSTGSPDRRKRLCVRAAGGDGYYDKGGAYWGSSPSEGPVFAVWNAGEGKTTCTYVRAQTKKAAIDKALEG